VYGLLKICRSGNPFTQIASPHGAFDYQQRGDGWVDVYVSSAATFYTPKLKGLTDTLVRIALPWSSSGATACKSRITSGHIDDGLIYDLSFITIVIAIVYYLLNQVTWLNDLGRAKRSHADTQMENILGHLGKMAIEHDKDEKTGNQRFFLATKASDAEVDD